MDLIVSVPELAYFTFFFFFFFFFFFAFSAKGDNFCDDLLLRGIMRLPYWT